MTQSNTALFPLTEYQQYLQRSAGVGERTIHSYTMALRRFFKHLDERDRQNEQMLAFYRGSLSRVMRGALGTAWMHFQAFAKENGVEGLRDMPHMPHTRFCHPLYPYVAELALLELDRVARLAPHEVPASHQHAVDAINLFAKMTGQGRVDFITGQRALAWDDWVLKQILRSPDVMTKAPIEKAHLNTIETLTRIPWKQLCEAGNEKRFLSDLMLLHSMFEKLRPLLLRRKNFKASWTKQLESIRNDSEAGTNWKEYRSALFTCLEGSTPHSWREQSIRMEFQREQMGNVPVFW